MASWFYDHKRSPQLCFRIGYQHPLEFIMYNFLC